MNLDNKFKIKDRANSQYKLQFNEILQIDRRKSCRKILFANPGSSLLDNPSESRNLKGYEYKNKRSLLLVLVVTS